MSVLELRAWLVELPSVQFGVPCGNRTGVAAVKEKRIVKFKGNLRHG
jgi:hypothetical protein